MAAAVSPPLDAWADARLAPHMVQHVLLTMAAGPLLAAGLLRLPRVHPVLAWLAFACTGWIVHFSPLFEASVEHVPVHVAEHALLLGTAVLFWGQVVGVGATLSYPLRLLYLGVAMPQNTFLALAISSSDRVLYPHYAVSPAHGAARALADQRLGGGIMWVAGDLILLGSVLLVAAAWARHEERETALSEAAADRGPSPRTAG